MAVSLDQAKTEPAIVLEHLLKEVPRFDRAVWNQFEVPATREELRDLGEFLAQREEERERELRIEANG